MIKGNIDKNIIFSDSLESLRLCYSFICYSLAFLDLHDAIFLGLFTAVLVGSEERSSRSWVGQNRINCGETPTIVAFLSEIIIFFWSGCVVISRLLVPLPMTLFC